MIDYEYENFRRVVYGDTSDGSEGATFIPVCPKGHFVKADDHIFFTEETIKEGPNATCKICGRVEMIFEGFY